MIIIKDHSRSQESRQTMPLKEGEEALKKFISLKFNTKKMNNPVKNTSEETQNVNSKKYKHPYDHCCLIYSCQDMEAAQVPISR